MKTYTFLNRIAFTAVLLTAVTSVAAAAADEAADVQQVAHCCEPTCGCNSGCSDSCSDGCCGDCCCRKVCVSSVETKKVEKHCWKTETKDVCIPKVVLPWQQGGCGLTLFDFWKKSGSACCGDACCGDACCGDACCGNACCGCNLKPRCGKVITVCDLKKEKYECEKCVCKWEIRRLPPCGIGCCDQPGCGEPCCDPYCGANADQITNDIRLTSSIEAPTNPLQATPAEPANAPSDSEKAADATWLQRLISRR